MSHRPELAASAGAQVTVFREIEGGHAAPVFQRVALGRGFRSAPQKRRASG